MPNVIKSGKPVKLKARLSMAAFVVVAVASLTLTSVGLLHAATQSAATAQGTNASTVLGIEVIR